MTIQIPTAVSAYRIAAVGVALALNLAVWVLLPTLLEGSIRLDVAEHVLQGREWLLAYPKHPPFSIWLVELASELGPARYILLYLLGQVLAISGLVAAAWLVRETGQSTPAIAILIGLSTPFLTYGPIQVNHNIGVMPFWGLALATGYAAFARGCVRDWLMFGAAIGIGMWAKYSILHLAVPLALLFFSISDWQRQLATPGPWLAGALAAAIVAPHGAAVLRQSGTSIDHALRTFSTGPLDNLAMCFGFLLQAGLLIAFMGVVAAATTGFSPLWRALDRSFTRARQDRLALYLHVALFGPILLIAFSALLFGIRPRTFWLAPIALSGAAWWADKAAAACVHRPLRAFKTAAAFGALFAASYVATRLLAPFTPIPPSYADFDGRALARLAERHWQTVGGTIPYIVSYGGQRGRQAAGSILFDLESRPRVFEDANPKHSPWIDLADLVRRGALVISTRPLTPADHVGGHPITRITEFERPTVRAGFRDPRKIYFGIVPPASQ